jgi:hypothetical protein
MIDITVWPVFEHVFGGTFYPYCVRWLVGLLGVFIYNKNCIFRNIFKVCTYFKEFEVISAVTMKITVFWDVMS